MSKNNIWAKVQANCFLSDFNMFDYVLSIVLIRLCIFYYFCVLYLIRNPIICLNMYWLCFNRYCWGVKEQLMKYIVCQQTNKINKIYLWTSVEHHRNTTSKFWLGGRGQNVDFTFLLIHFVVYVSCFCVLKCSCRYSSMYNKNRFFKEH